MIKQAMPAEWEEQEAVWFSWPLNPLTWPGRLGTIQKAFAKLIAAATRFETVRVNCIADQQAAMLRELDSAGARLDRLECFNIPTNDVWCRDHGPTFVREGDSGKVRIVDWRYNAWGGKFPPWDADDAVPARIAESLNIPSERIDLVCEGGAIEVNGNGVLLSTESVLLNPNRNPGRSRREIEHVFQAALGVDTVFWLESGMECDDTDGHIDTLARFWRADGIAAPRARSGQPDHMVLERNWERLHDLRTDSGGRFDLVAIPHPEPLHDTRARGDRLPATYANFLILNGAVIIPAYNQARTDMLAKGLLGELFPGREMLAIESVEILSEGGSFHCLSQQQPVSTDLK